MRSTTATRTDFQPLQDCSADSVKTSAPADLCVGQCRHGHCQQALDDGVDFFAAQGQRDRIRLEGALA